MTGMQHTQAHYGHGTYYAILAKFGTLFLPQVPFQCQLTVRFQLIVSLIFFLIEISDRIDQVN